MRYFLRVVSHRMNILLPNRRRYLQLRDQTEVLLGLVRELNDAAIGARDDGHDVASNLEPIVARLHHTVDRLAEVAGVAARHGALESARPQPKVTASPSN